MDGAIFYFNIITADISMAGAVNTSDIVAETGLLLLITAPGLLLLLLLAFSSSQDRVHSFSSFAVFYITSFNQRHKYPPHTFSCTVFL